MLFASVLSPVGECSRFSPDLAVSSSSDLADTGWATDSSFLRGPPDVALLVFAGCVGRGDDSATAATPVRLSGHWDPGVWIDSYYQWGIPMTAAAARLTFEIGTSLNEMTGGVAGIGTGDTASDIKPTGVAGAAIP